MATYLTHILRCRVGEVYTTVNVVTDYLVCFDF